MIVVGIDYVKVLEQGERETSNKECASQSNVSRVRKMGWPRNQNLEEEQYEPICLREKTKPINIESIVG